jgi:NADH dehydrogenase (ubiquinone) 1 alpha subcomplex subunit 9
VVINLIGHHYETKNFSFEGVNVTGPALLAKAAKEARIERLVHVSALDASHNSSSAFLRSKARGEEAG